MGVAEILVISVSEPRNGGNVEKFSDAAGHMTPFLWPVNIQL